MNTINKNTHNNNILTPLNDLRTYQMYKLMRMMYKDTTEYVLYTKLYLALII